MRKFQFILFLPLLAKGQIINYVSNGSFEALNSFSASSKYNVVEYWQPIDTGKACDYLVTLIPSIANGPYALGFQYPRTGLNYDVSEYLNFRGYPRNRLKARLKPNVTYCAKYHIVNTNSNPYAIDSFGMVFADSTLDTIKYCNVPLSYLIPQIENASGNIITDTLNWTAISGTFVATGQEKYLVLGNFKSDASTNSLMINPTYSTTITSVICIDDVSCFELNAPAYAGPDRVISPGDSTFIGSEPDFAVDPYCTWYKLPSMTAIDTVAGLYVKPVQTATYAVRMELECNSIKWDTVVVHVNLVGMKDYGELRRQITLAPNPCSGGFSFSVPGGMVDDLASVYIISTAGETVFSSSTANTKTNYDVSALPPGMYTVIFRTRAGVEMAKVLVVER